MAVRTVAFTVTLPHGWSDVTANPSVAAAVRPDGNLLLLLEGPPPTPVVRGANDVTGVIVVTALRQPLAASQVAAYLQSVRASGAQDISAPTSTMVGRTAATAITYGSTLDGTPIETEDVVVAHAGAMYEVELITSRVLFDSQAAVFDRMLRTGWVWVSGD